MRLVMTCRKEGEKMFVNIEDGRAIELALPLQQTELAQFFEHIYTHLLLWFEGRVDQYDNGQYGNADIGFDIMRDDS